MNPKDKELEDEIRDELNFLTYKFYKSRDEKENVYYQKGWDDAFNYVRNVILEDRINKLKTKLQELKK